MIEFWQEDLRKAANPEKIKIFMSFFKTGKGEYGEGDKFIGLSVPENRRIARKYLVMRFTNFVFRDLYAWSKNIKDARIKMSKMPSQNSMLHVEHLPIIGTWLIYQLHIY